MYQILSSMASSSTRTLRAAHRSHVPLLSPGLAAYSPFSIKAHQTRLFKSDTPRFDQASPAEAPGRKGAAYNNVGQMPSLIGDNVSSRMPPRVPAPPLSGLLNDVIGAFPSASESKSICSNEPLQTDSRALDKAVATPVYHHGTKFDRVPYWQNIGRWKDIPEAQFLTYRWNVSRQYPPATPVYSRCV